MADQSEALAQLAAGNQQQLTMASDGPRVRNQDKRTSRIENADSFQRAILDERARRPTGIGIAEDTEEVINDGISVVLRKRPMFPKEVHSGDYDATTVSGRQIIVHDGRMKPDMVHMEMKHHTYSFPRVFDEHTSNDPVYQDGRKERSSSRSSSTTTSTPSSSPLGGVDRADDSASEQRQRRRQQRKGASRSQLSEIDQSVLEKAAAVELRRRASLGGTSAVDTSSSSSSSG